MVTKTQALQDALELCVKEMCGNCKLEAFAQGREFVCVDGCGTIRMARKVLAMPMRNCDVGYVEDQIQRYSEFCRNHKRLKAPPVHSLEWAQRPYEESGTMDKEGSDHA